MLFGNTITLLYNTSPCVLLSDRVPGCLVGSTWLATCQLNTKGTALQATTNTNSHQTPTAHRLGTVLVVIAMMFTALALGQPSADASELEFARDEVMRFGESCPAGTRDVGRTDNPLRRLAVCRPDGFVPIASPTYSSDTCGQARAAGVFGVWVEGDPVSVCLTGWSAPVPEAGCWAARIETTIRNWDNELITVCATPVLVKNAAPPATAVTPLTAICVNDDVLLNDDDAADFEVGTIFTAANGRDYLVTSGAWCGYGCIDGFDMNCDGKLFDMCPSEFNFRSVSGAKSCLASIE